MKAQADVYDVILKKMATDSDKDETDLYPIAELSQSTDRGVATINGIVRSLGGHGQEGFN